MSFTFTSGPHQTIEQQFPPMAYKTVNTGTWGSGGNTCVITDPGIKPNSNVHVWVVGATPQADFWAIGTPTAGSVTITSGSAESSTLTLAYVVY